MNNCEHATEHVRADGVMVGSLIMLEHIFPCKVTTFSHTQLMDGTGKATITGTDIFTGKQYK